MHPSRIRSKYLAEWRGYRQSCQRLKDDRARAASLVLCRAMVDWLEGNATPPAEAVVRAVLRARPSDAVFYGGLALGHMARLDAAVWPMVMGVFGRASIRACDSILTYMGPPVQDELLVTLARAAFAHKAWQVRQKAVEKVYFWRLGSLPSLLQELRAVEKDTLVLGSIAEYEALHRDGFHAVFDKYSWSWRVTYPFEKEGTTSVDIPKAVVDAIGLERAVAHVRACPLGSFVAWDEIVDGA